MAPGLRRDDNVDGAILLATRLNGAPVLRPTLCSRICGVRHQMFGSYQSGFCGSQAPLAAAWGRFAAGGPPFGRIPADDQTRRSVRAGQSSGPWYRTSRGIPSTEQTGQSKEDLSDAGAQLGVRMGGLRRGPDLLCFPGRTPPRGRGDVCWLWFSLWHGCLCYLSPAREPFEAFSSPALLGLGLLGRGLGLGAVLALARGSDPHPYPNVLGYSVPRRRGTSEERTVLAT
jgi:hypothetical protein